MGTSTIAACPFLYLPPYADRSASLSEELDRALQADARREAPIESPTTLKRIKPCAEDVTKVTVDARLVRAFRAPRLLDSELFDMSTCDWLLKATEPFTDTRCSEKLGVAKAVLCGMTVMVFRDGRLNIRAAANEHVAEAVIHFAGRALRPSVICACGNALFECAGGGCLGCVREGCAASMAEPLTLPQPGVSGVSLSSIALPLLNDSEATALLDSAGQSTLQVYQRLRRATSQTAQGNARSQLLQDAERTLLDVSRKATRVLARAPDERYTQSALQTVGRILSLRRIVDAIPLATCNGQPLTAACSALLTQAVKICFPPSDRSLLSQPGSQLATEERFEAFGQCWKTTLQASGNPQWLAALHKVAVNCVYLMRLRDNAGRQASSQLMSGSRASSGSVG